ncbi:regulatory sensor-transducer, BlaR1/MecR1 family protein, partial [Flavobacterium sp. HMWF030]
MTDFLIKSTIALCVLLGAYYLFLEKEKFHQFNRFFLLASLVISFVIPFVTIEIIQQISAVANNSVVIPEQVTTNVVVEKTSIFIIIGWFLYGVVTT